MINKRGGGSRIEINTLARRLHHYNGTRLIKEYPVAVGKPSTPTPPGDYHIINKLVNPGGMLGTRWMGMSIPGGNYGIHGTNNPSSIGQAVSHGCVRMYNHHVEEIFPQITIGTPVHIYARTGQKSSPGSSTGKGKTYTVKPGDTLWQIAQSFKVSLEALVAANNLTDPDRIVPGQVIVIP